MPILTDVAKKIMYTLACVAGLGAVCLGCWCFALRAENKRLGGAVRAAEDALRIESDLRAADRAIAVRYAKQVQTLTAQHRSQNAELQQALQASPSWAAERVPDSVASALGLHSSP